MATTNIPYFPMASTDGLEVYWIDDGTGGRPCIRYYETGWTPDTGLNSTESDKTLDIAKVVTKEDLKMMKDEVKKYMKNQMVKDARKIAGKLFDDIDKLKEEKTQLKKDVTELKRQVKQVKVDIQVELTAIEEMMEKKAKEIFRFAELDFSR